MTNMDKLYEAVEARGPVCVGLDTDFSYLPADFVDSTLSKGENIVRFNKKLIDATKAVAGCYKVQIAYYESLGLEGLKAYADTLKAVREAGVPVIADIKRGDIAKTAEMYAMGHFTGDFEADFVTLAPYMGLDSISPYLPYAEKQGKGMFVLCRTSNGGAKDFEYEKLADGRHVYDLVGDKLNALGKDYMGEHGYSSIGLVIGGTHIEEATEIRAKYQDSFFLIPGYGAQGGKAEDIAQYLTKGNGGVCFAVCVHGADAALRPACPAAAGSVFHAHPPYEFRRFAVDAGDPGAVLRTELLHQRLSGTVPRESQHGFAGGHRLCLLFCIQCGDDVFDHR